MTIQDLYISRPGAEAFLKEIENAVQDPAQSAVLFQIWGLGGVGKITFLRKVQEIGSGSAFASVYFGRTEGTEVPIKLMKTLYDQLKEIFSPPPLLKRDLRELQPKPDPFLTLYNQYFDTIHQLETQSADGKGSASSEQLTLVKQIMERGSSAVSWRVTAMGLPEVAAMAIMAGKAASEVTDKMRSGLSWKDQIEQLLRQHSATKQKRELQELMLEPVAKLTQAFVETLNQWSKKRPILLLMDTYEMVPPAVDHWLCQSLLGNNTSLREYSVRLVVAGRNKQLPVTSYQLPITSYEFDR